MTATPGSTLKIRRLPPMTAKVHVKWDGDRTPLQAAPGELWILQCTNTTLYGSADSYAATVHDTGRFFVHYFTRHCSKLKNLLGDRLKQDCTSITNKMVPPKWATSAPGHPALRGKFMLILRDYTNPGTPTGPDPSKMLRPTILTFIKP